MSRLFIHVYLDEDVSALLADLLRSRQYEVTTTLEAGNVGRSDAEQLAFATERGMAIVTHNRADFDALAQQYVTSGRTHAGIIMAVRRPEPQLARRLIAILDSVTADEMDNQVRYI
jgi:predicted nuclease of predicted toxin-antitoxin system